MNVHEALVYLACPELHTEASTLEAGLALVRGRGDLRYRVFFKIPDPPEGMTTNRDPKWAEIKAGSTGERCACGNCRTIWPTSWPLFEEGSECVLRGGETVYLVPVGGTYREATVSLTVMMPPETKEPVFTFIADPFSDTMKVSLLTNGPTGYSLAQLVNALSRQSKPAPMVMPFPEGSGMDVETMTLFTVKSATVATVVLGIGKGTVVSRNPKEEHILPR